MTNVVTRDSKQGSPSCAGGGSRGSSSSRRTGLTSSKPGQRPANSRADAPPATRAHHSPARRVASRTTRDRRRWSPCRSARGIARVSTDRVAADSGASATKSGSINTDDRDAYSRCGRPTRDSAGPDCGILAMRKHAADQGGERNLSAATLRIAEPSRKASSSGATSASRARAFTCGHSSTLTIPFVVRSPPR
jgi:hypothetical protein